MSRKCLELASPTCNYEAATENKLSGLSQMSAMRRSPAGRQLVAFKKIRIKSCQLLFAMHAETKGARQITPHQPSWTRCRLGNARGIHSLAAPSEPCCCPAFQGDNLQPFALHKAAPTTPTQKLKDVARRSTTRLPECRCL